MGLFDDLMKKPAPAQDVTGSQGSAGAGQGQQTQGGTGQGLPIITEQTTIVSQNVPMSSIPQEVASSNNPSPIIEQGGLVIQKTAEESILTEKPVILNKELPEVPAATVNSASEDDGSLIIVGNGGPGNLIIPQNVLPDALQSTTPSIVQQAPMSLPNNTVPVSPIQNTIPAVTQQVDNTQTMGSFQFADTKSEPDFSTLAQQNESMLSNLFGEPPKVETPPVVEPTPEVAETEVPLFENPIAFINESLEKIDVMIAHIDETHDAKLAEAAGYKGEKERFAELEANAYQDGRKMMKERAHAEVMKKYFLDQKKQALQIDKEVNRESVETTLTSLSVKNSVNKATTNNPRKRIQHKSVKK